MCALFSPSGECYFKRNAVRIAIMCRRADPYEYHQPFKYGKYDITDKFSLNNNCYSFYSHVGHKN